MSDESKSDANVDAAPASNKVAVKLVNAKRWCESSFIGRRDMPSVLETGDIIHLTNSEVQSLGILDHTTVDKKGNVLPVFEVVEDEGDTVSKPATKRARKTVAK